MEEEKEILTRKEHIINLFFYIFRYTLYWIAFAWLGTIIGEPFSGFLLLAFLYLSQLHMENEKKIEKAIISENIRKHDELMKKINKNEENI